MGRHYTPTLTTLPNGIQVVTVYRPGKVCRLTTTVKVGSAHEKDSNAGISHLVEHIVSNGITSNLCAHSKFDVETDAHTLANATQYIITGDISDIESYVNLQADSIMNSAFPECQFDREKQVVLQEMYSGDSPLDVANQKFTWACFVDQSLGRPIIGYEETVKSITQEQAYCFYKQHYVGNNIIVSAVGDIKHTKFVELVSEYYLGLQAGTPSQTTTGVVTPGFNYTPYPIKQNAVVIGFPSGDLTGSDCYCALILVALLDRELTTELRDRAGIVYSCDAGIRAISTAGVVSISTRTTPEHMHQLLETIAQVLKGMQKLDEYNHTTHMLIEDMLFDSTNIEFKTCRYAEDSLINYNTIESYDSFINGAYSITTKQIEEFASKMIRSDPVLVIVGNDPEADTYYDFLRAKLAS